MLKILNVDIIDEKKINVVRRKTKKTQIFLFDTQRRFDDYIMKVVYRLNGKYDDIPHFIINKSGDIYQIFDENYYSKTFGNEHDKRLIKIALENMGWLNKNTITGVLNNWINDPYRSEPYIKKWRNFYYWEKYTDEQIQSTINLSQVLCKRNKIPYVTVPSQGYIENLTKFKGIVCKSNFDTIYTDINPSFNLDKFYIKKEKNE